MKYFRYIFYTVLIAAAMSIPAFSQETQTRVVDEVIAVVNDGVITLSRVKRESKNIVDTYVQEGKSREEAQKLVDEKQGELIANLINEELLVQKAKDAGLDAEIESSINDRFLEIMKQYNLKTVEALYAEMERTGVDPKEVREAWRKQAVRDKVLQREVQAKVYWSFNGKELKDYYEKNKAKFSKPETVSFSELFLGFAGRDEAAVRTKATQIYDQLKAGGDWEKILKENADPGVLTQGVGKAERVLVADLPAKYGTPLKAAKVGGYTPPLDIDQLGVAILKIDAHEQASSESVFDENAVRIAMMGEKYPAETKKYLARLRDDSYIKISDAYRPLVSPILFAEERKEAAKGTAQ